jgi:DNA-3-methyladenine glycosylase
MTKSMRLGPEFFKRDTARVASDLLGMWLVRRRGTSTMAAVVTETEAYHGPYDRASHASRGMTARTSVMFGPPGTTYVYLVYGMHHCLNVVTMPEGFPAAVLIRGARLPGADGPGKLCRIFGISRAQNALPPGNEELWFEDRGTRIPDRAIVRGPRVGVAYAGSRWAAKLWRFSLAR